MAFDNEKFLNQYKEDINIQPIRLNAHTLNRLNIYITACVDSNIPIEKEYLRIFLERNKISSKLTVVKYLLGYDTDNKDDDYHQFEWLAQSQVLSILLELNFEKGVKAWLESVPEKHQKKYSNFSAIKSKTEEFLLKNTTQQDKTTKKFVL